MSHAWADVAYNLSDYIGVFLVFIGIGLATRWTS